MFLRNGIYHYRRRIPSAFVDLFGRKEVTKSLGTGDVQKVCFTIPTGEANTPAMPIKKS